VQEDDTIVVDSGDWDLAWMYNRAIPGPSAFPPLGDDEVDEAGTLVFIEAYCGECHATYTPDHLAVERWSYNHGFLAAAAGRRLLCPKQHVILEVTDMVS